MGEHDGHRERLRMRYLEHGLDALQDHEVLELLLFYAVPRKDTNPMARKLLRQFGSLSAVLDAPLQDLKAAAELSDIAAILLQLIPDLARRYQLSRTRSGTILNSTEDCGRFVLPYFFGATDEMVYLICLDAKKKVLACRLLQRGCVDFVGFSIRKVAEIAMSCNAVSVVLAHNRPGGMALPSTTDYQTTEALRSALSALGIEVLDHLVVCDSDYVSMADNGYFR